MAREYFPGMGQAVADRTVNRPGETWGDVAARVAHGNTLLDPTCYDRDPLEGHIAQATILMSGRHLQHGDSEQPSRPMEVYTNCSTSMLRSLTFKLLLSGSGVGGCYDDDLMAVDWTKMPIVVPVIDWSHADGLQGYQTVREAQHLYAGHEQIVFRVPDTREGWAKCIELIERLAYEQRTNVVLILDFSDVRPAGAPIRGMQNRPASGPGPLMGAISNVAKIRGTNMARWRAAMYIDHYLAECVLVGGARRAARIAVKTWYDPTVFDFINVKRPIEFHGKSREEVEELRRHQTFNSFLWSSNNSVAVDRKFWRLVREAFAGRKLVGERMQAWDVFRAVMAANYGDGTGEPGFINVDMLDQNVEGLDDYLDFPFAGSDLYQFDDETLPLIRDLTERVLGHYYQFIVNPCGEIALFILGGFCVIGDLVLFHAKGDDDAEEAVRQITRALIRTNRMRSIYNAEVERTNRIGVSLTGIHEYAWSRFQLGFRDLVAEDPDGTVIVDANGEELIAPHPDAMAFWLRLRELANIVDIEAQAYSKELGVTVPHTNRTIKPAGTTSKLFGLTEGAHLPAMREYLRWVQFRNGDPLIAEYAAKGYPTRELKSYSGTTIVGFPTAPVICQLGMGDKLVTASEATPMEQFRWLRLLETFWIGKERGNQVSYTLKYDPKVVDYDTFERIMLENVPKVRAVSVMPAIEATSYEYQPETPVTKLEYEQMVAAITEEMVEDVDKVHVDCVGGACPVDFSKA
jgi:hypothetical protein